ncbi:uncharacterized protein BDV14DRAFT_168328 [Aspergillus stella-maris]|uniref:uncharacterized protein n=1 Tax=Aspergillus stella-maris TaxID=1810926 RepID=UPI003CCD39AD
MTATQLPDTLFPSKDPIQIRPKKLLTSLSYPPSLKRKRHAESQKHQRDRMKAALKLMARTLEARGVNPPETRAEIVETAVEYILDLQRQLDGLKSGDA